RGRARLLLALRVVAVLADAGAGRRRLDLARRSGRGARAGDRRAYLRRGQAWLVRVRRRPAALHGRGVEEGGRQWLTPGNWRAAAPAARCASLWTPRAATASVIAK